MVWCSGSLGLRESVLNVLRTCTAYHPPSSCNTAEVGAARNERLRVLNSLVQSDRDSYWRSFGLRQASSVARRMEDSANAPFDKHRGEVFFVSLPPAHLGILRSSMT
ncbi:hypothetical protein AB1N83_010889 [Pleurotus pulmonarius]